MTFKSKVFAGFGTALMILILVGVLSYRSQAQTDGDMEWVTHTHQVIEKLNAASNNLLVIETSQRGYLLTGEPSYLYPYNNGFDLVRKNLKDVRNMTSDNPVQQQALDGLEPLILERLRTAAERIDIRDRSGLVAAADSVRDGPGKQLMDQVQAGLSGMKQEEDRLLIIRTKEAARSSQNARIVIVTGDVLAVAFLCVAGMIVGQEFRQRRNAETAVRTLNAELEQRVADRTAELSERAKELARSNSELQQFAYVASHDLQEPLRMVASFTQLLAKRYAEKLDADARDFINFAVDGATRMQTLISDLLHYSRVGTQGKELVAVDCEELFQGVLQSLQLTIEESEAAIVSDPLPMVMADPQQLGQLLQNLLTNAIKFRGPEPPQIRISAEPLSNEWKISVRDNGIGIAKEHSDRIFIIFQRLHTKSEYPGTGIGLAVCKKIVERHGGRIWFEPSPGGGTTFCFTIPAAEQLEKIEREKNEFRITASTR